MNRTALARNGLDRSRLKWTALALVACVPLLSIASNGISKVNGTVHVDAGQQAGDIDTVNGTIHIDAGASVGSANTVNGSIHVADRVTAGKLETVNGSVKLGAGVKARSLGTVNGALIVGDGSQIENEISTVNGAIVLEKDADVGGKLSTVNGRMELDNAHVVGRLETVNGDILVGAGSRVDGGILVEKPDFNLFNRKRRTPKIVIGPNATVQGTLKFEHDVELYVSDKATVGRIEGATAIKFSGDRPSDVDMARQPVEK